MIKQALAVLKKQLLVLVSTPLVSGFASKDLCLGHLGTQVQGEILGKLPALAQYYEDGEEEFAEAQQLLQHAGCGIPVSAKSRLPFTHVPQQDVSSSSVSGK